MKLTRSHLLLFVFFGRCARCCRSRLAWSRTRHRTPWGFCCIGVVKLAKIISYHSNLHSESEFQTNEMFGEIVESSLTRANFVVLFVKRRFRSRSNNGWLLSRLLDGLRTWLWSSWLWLWSSWLWLWSGRLRSCWCFSFGRLWSSWLRSCWCLGFRWLRSSWRFGAWLRRTRWSLHTSWKRLWYRLSDWSFCDFVLLVLLIEGDRFGSWSLRSLSCSWSRSGSSAR